MPTYDFKNKETGELTEKFFTSFSKREEYLAENPHLEPVIGAAAIIDPTRLMGVRGIDNGFREVLQKIHERSPGSTLKDSIR
jgi:hypothetical protein